MHQVLLLYHKIGTRSNILRMFIVDSRVGWKHFACVRQGLESNRRNAIALEDEVATLKSTLQVQYRLPLFVAPDGILSSSLLLFLCLETNRALFLLFVGKNFGASAP